MGIEMQRFHTESEEKGLLEKKKLDAVGIQPASVPADNKTRIKSNEYYERTGNQPV